MPNIAILALVNTCAEFNLASWTLENGTLELYDLRSGNVTYKVDTFDNWLSGPGQVYCLKDLTFRMKVTNFPG